MSTDSALVGQKPANQHDKDIIEGFWRLAGHTMGPSSNPSGSHHPPIIPVKGSEPRPHDSRQWEMYAQLSSVMILMVLITITRLLLRLCKKELRWGLDDWTIGVALGLAMGYCGLRIELTRYGGAGKHTYDATYAEYEEFFANLISKGIYFYFCALGFVKISICLFNRRLTSLTSRKWSIYHYALITFIALFMLALILAEALICMPLFNWRLSELGTRNYKTHCYDGKPMVTFFAALHVAIDLFILPVPLIVIKKLNLTMWQRVRLIFLFTIGLCSVIGAVMQIVHTNSQKYDVLYQFPDFNRWQLMDLTFGVAVASLPTLNALLPRSWRKGSPIVRSEVTSEGSKSKSGQTDTSATQATTQVNVDGDRDVEKVDSLASSEPWEQKKWDKIHDDGSDAMKTGPSAPKKGWEKFYPNLKI